MQSNAVIPRLQNKDRSLYDYQGDEFLSSKDAFDFAQATAHSLKNALDADWTGWSVEVRDAGGKRYFSFPLATGQTIAPPSSSGSNPQRLGYFRAAAAAEQVSIWAAKRQ
jgi:hypothetical protein